MPRIALEEHFIPPGQEYVDRWLSLVPNVPPAGLAAMLPKLSDLGSERLDAMSKAGIDMAVLSNVGTVQGTLDPTPALRLAQQANDYLAEAVRKQPTRYAGFATVPLQAKDAGADELERSVKELGLKGAMIVGHTNGLYLDDDRFQPFWERAEALGVPVYLHAADPLVMPRTYFGRPELIGATWSWTAETAAHTLRLIFSGVLKLYPKTQLLLGHLGETLPYLLWRLNSRANAFGEGEQSKPGDIVRKNIAVTSAGMFSDEPFFCALNALGEDSLMFSVDHPFESMDIANQWFEKVSLSAEQRDKVAWKNASRFLKLSEPSKA